mgnify:CR=1 FL=1
MIIMVIKLKMKGMMMNKMQEVETEIMDCWRVVDDIDVLFKYFGDDEFFIGMKAEHADKIMNLMLGVRELYSVKFERLWRAYEDSLGEYYSYEKEALRSRNTSDRRLNDVTPEEWDKATRNANL